MTIQLEIDTSHEVLEFSGQEKIKDTKYKYKSSYKFKANLNLDCDVIFELHKTIASLISNADDLWRAQNHIVDTILDLLSIAVAKDYSRENLDNTFIVDSYNSDDKIFFTIDVQLKCIKENVLNFKYILGEHPRLDFYKGIRAAADYLFMRAANCFHPSYPKESELEDRVLHDAAKVILEELSPDDYNKWKDIGILHKQLKDYETQIQSLKTKLEEFSHIEKG